jgi:alanine-glyoxylate transaminase/serine-glyoxylate transaminase/serine-pyruvate transaminase
MGLSYIPPRRSLAVLNAVHALPSVDDAVVRRRLLEEFGIEIGAGLGPFKGKAWRIGLMGASSTRRNVVLVLTALEAILGDLGVGVDRGMAVAEAMKTYTSSE